ncbi:hypothetical protein [Neisseria sp. P0014.S009]|uniref:hypothetical protein n=1 Tax=unclassified Neisseria TaxID=2623750 RepID=UPI003F7EB631
MAKFIKSFYGVPNGEIYPVRYNVGDEIPEEFLEVAEKLGAVEVSGKGDKKQRSDSGDGQGDDGQKDKTE